MGVCAHRPGEAARTSQGRRAADPAWVGARGGLGWWGAGWGGGGRGGGDVGVVVAGAVGGAGESWGERAVGAARVGRPGAQRRRVSRVGPHAAAGGDL